MFKAFQSPATCLTALAIGLLSSPGSIFGQAGKPLVKELPSSDLQQVIFDEDGRPISVMEAFEPIRVADNSGNSARRPRTPQDVPAILAAPPTRSPDANQRRQDNSPPPLPPAVSQPRQFMPTAPRIQASPGNFLPTAGPTRLPVAQPDVETYLPAAPVKPMSIQKAAPKIDTQVELPGYINLNQPAKMQVKLYNSGDTSAASVKLLATIPSHARFAGSTPQPTNVNGQVYEFQLFDFGAKQTREVIIELIPTEKKALEIGTEIVIENAQQFTVSVREPKIKLSLQGPTETNLGSNIMHKVLLENVGDGLAERLDLHAIFPQELRCVKKSQMVIPSLEPGQKIEIEMPSQATSAGESEMTVSVSAIGVEGQTVRSGIRIFQPELEIAAAGPQINFVNREGIYSVNLNNVGAIDASEVTIELRMPAGMKITTISHEAKIDPKTGVLTWNFDRITSKSEQTIKFMTIATAAGSQDCVFTVRSKETRDKTIFLTTNVVTRAELNITVQNQSGPVQIGGQAQFLVIVENTGSQQASNLSVQVELPEALTADKQDGIDVLSLGNNISFEAAKLEPGQKREFRFTAVASQAGEHVVRSVLKTDASERQLTSEGVVYVYEVNQSRVSENLAPAVVR